MLVCRSFLTGMTCVAALSCGGASGTPDSSGAKPDSGAIATDGGPDAGGGDETDAGWAADFDVEILDGPRETFSLVELRLGYETSAGNPFDPDEVEVIAEFKKPSGGTDKVRGFWFQGYDLSENPDTGGESLAPDGAPHFRVRYTPPEPGRYLFRVTATESGRTEQYGYSPFEIVDSGAKGFAGINPENPRYFGFADGTGFFPTGFNVGWYGSKGYFDYVRHIDRLSAAGGNYFRMWMIKWSNAIEWTAGNGAGDFGGLGRYALDNAYRIDRIVSHAESRSVKLMLTFGSYLEHTTGGYWNEGAWPENPYNAQNGGPCADASEFFSHRDAKRIYKNRLSYIAARWGYSTAVFSWELWNEVLASVEWVREMGRHLRAEDLARHLVSTTYGGKDVYDLPEIDFSQRHMYGSPDDLIYDYPERIAENVSEFSGAHEKPHLLAEFGIDWSNSDAYWDPDGEGVNFHNGVFSAVASGAAGTAMLWWWDDYIEKFDLYGGVSPVAAALSVFDGRMAGVNRLDLDPAAIPPGTIAYGIGRDDAALVWMAAKDSTWKNAYENVPPAGVPASSIKVPGLTPGCAASLGVFDAWTGEPLSSFEGVADPSGTVTAPTPEFERDVYVHVRCPGG